MSGKKFLIVSILIIMQFAIMVNVAVFMFKVKYENYTLQQDLAILNKQMSKDSELLHLYKTEFALLTSPDSMKKYVDNYLLDENLTHISNAQLKDFEKLRIYLNTNLYSKLQ